MDIFGTSDMCFADVTHHNSADGVVGVYWVNTRKLDYISKNAN